MSLLQVALPLLAAAAGRGILKDVGCLTCCHRFYAKSSTATRTKGRKGEVQDTTAVAGPTHAGDSNELSTGAPQTAQAGPSSEKVQGCTVSACMAIQLAKRQVMLLDCEHLPNNDIYACSTFVCRLTPCRQGSLYTSCLCMKGWPRCSLHVRSLLLTQVQNLDAVIKMINKKHGLNTIMRLGEAPLQM